MTDYSVKIHLRGQNHQVRRELVEGRLFLQQCPSRRVEEVEGGVGVERAEQVQRVEVEVR